MNLRSVLVRGDGGKCFEQSGTRVYSRPEHLKENADDHESLKSSPWKPARKPQAWERHRDTHAQSHPRSTRLRPRAPTGMKYHREKMVHCHHHDKVAHDRA